jgi:hypothetical protein
VTIWGKLTAEPARPILPGDAAAQAAPGAGAGPVAGAGPAVGVEAASAEADNSLPDPTGLAGTIAFLLFVVAVVLAVVLNAAGATADEFDPSSNAAADFALFAGFYVAAQVIERVMEFVAPVLPPGDPAAWLKNRFALGTGFDKIKDDRPAMAAQIKADRGKLVLGVAVIFGVLASCLFGLFFLKAIGMHVSHTVDSILTGITIAAGTKPLHDFITSLQNNNTPTTTTGMSGS